MSSGPDEQHLTKLHPLERNRYYYGKLLDALHLSMEQEYGRANRELHNRLVVGPGVVCGLETELVQTNDGWAIQIGSGMAIDGWGRPIVVPVAVSQPLAITGPCQSPGCGPPGATAGADLPSNLQVKLCCLECAADYAPALMSDPDCGGAERCEPGTIVESFCISIVEGSAPLIPYECAPKVAD